MHRDGLQWGRVDRLVRGGDGELRRGRSDDLVLGGENAVR